MAWTQNQSQMILLYLPWGNCEQLVSAKIAQTGRTSRYSKWTHFTSSAKLPEMCVLFDRITEVTQEQASLRFVFCRELSAKKGLGVIHLRKWNTQVINNNCFQNYEERSYFPPLFIIDKINKVKSAKLIHTSQNITPQPLSLQNKALIMWKNYPKSTERMRERHLENRD